MTSEETPVMENAPLAVANTANDEAHDAPSNLSATTKSDPVGTPMRQAAKKAMALTTTATRKRKAPSLSMENIEDVDERKPKRRGRPPKTPVAEDKKQPGRKKSPKNAVSAADVNLERRLNALEPSVKAMFGAIVWVKMGGFPYWPALVADPRRLVNKKQKANACKHLETKFFVYFYGTNNFAWILFKNVEPWNDDKHPYREGYPAKESKAPKRHAQLMDAIAEADEDVKLPMEERANGLLAIDPSTAATSKRKAAEKSPKRKKSKKSEDDEEEEEEVEEPEEEEEEEPDDEPAASPPSEKNSEMDDDEDNGAVLSKEEIKAKIASRKTPSKKTNDGSSPENSTAQSTGKKARGRPKTKVETVPLDSKRKREIELVVPRKSVKSSDIKQATDEAAKKSLDAKKQQKDVIAYSIGNMRAFASKLARLHANESSKNNDEALQMLNALFSEKVVYRSDVERSGLAAIVAVLRKSTNPTLAQTASALRKHMMTILIDDTEIQKDEKDDVAKEEETDTEAKPATVESAAAAEPEKPSEKPTSPVKQAAPALPVKKSTEATTDAVKKPTSPVKNEATKQKPASPVKQPEENAKPSTDTVTDPTSPVKQTQAKPESPVKKSKDKAPVDTKPSGSPPKKPASPKKTSTDMTVDKNRQVVIEMLGKVMAPHTTAHETFAKDIEHHLFERFMESNEEYKSQARMITKGLEQNETVRKRVLAGSLHGLELAFASDEMFTPSSYSS